MKRVYSMVYSSAREKSFPFFFQRSEEFVHTFFDPAAFLAAASTQRVTRSMLVRNLYGPYQSGAVVCFDSKPFFTSDFLKRREGCISLRLSQKLISHRSMKIEHVLYHHLFQARVVHV